MATIRQVSIPGESLLDGGFQGGSCIYGVYAFPTPSEGTFVPLVRKEMARMSRANKQGILNAYLDPGIGSCC